MEGGFVEGEGEGVRALGRGVWVYDLELIRGTLRGCMIWLRAVAFERERCLRASLLTTLLAVTPDIDNASALLSVNGSAYAIDSALAPIS